MTTSRTSLLVAVLLASLAVIAALGPARADPIVVGEEHCVVNVRSDDVLNMRAQSSAASAVVGQKRYGACGVRVTNACMGSWCPVEDGHVMGWAHRRYIAMVSPSLYCVSGVGPGDVLNLRAYPSTTSRILTSLAPHQCDIAFLPYAIGNWQKIRVEGWEGWINRRYVSGE